MRHRKKSRRLCVADQCKAAPIVRFGRLATILPETMTHEEASLRVVRLTPAIDSRRVALLQRRGGYRSAAARAFVAAAKDYAKAIEGRGGRRKHRIG